MSNIPTVAIQSENMDSYVEVNTVDDTHVDQVNQVDEKSPVMLVDPVVNSPVVNPIVDPVVTDSTEVKVNDQQTEVKVNDQQTEVKSTESTEVKVNDQVLLKPSQAKQVRFAKHVSFVSRKIYALAPSSLNLNDEVPKLRFCSPVTLFTDEICKKQNLSTLLIEAETVKDNKDSTNTYVGCYLTNDNSRRNEQTQQTRGQTHEYPEEDHHVCDDCTSKTSCLCRYDYIYLQAHICEEADNYFRVLRITDMNTVFQQLSDEERYQIMRAYPQSMLYVEPSLDDMLHMVRGNFDSLTHVTSPQYNKNYKKYFDVILGYAYNLYKGYVLRYVDTNLLSVDFINMVLTRHGDAIKYIANPTNDQLRIALKTYPAVFNMIHNPTYDDCLSAVKMNGWAIAHMKNQTEELCLAAVNQDGHTVMDCQYQTPAVCLAAVRNKGTALQYIRDKQTPEICAEAVKRSHEALQFVEDLTLAICVEAVPHGPVILNYIPVKLYYQVLQLFPEYIQNDPKYTHAFARQGFEQLPPIPKDVTKDVTKTVVQDEQKTTN